MDNLENQTSPQPGSPDSLDLQAQFNALHDLVNRILVLAVVASGAFSVYVISQWWFVRAELQRVRPQIQAMVAQSQKTGPAVDEFVRKLVEFSRTNPDFVPILQKYPIGLQAPTGAAPATGPVKAAPTAPKKK